MKKIVKLQILGQNFTLSSESDEAYIQKIGDYVEKKVQDILNYSKAIASFNAAILAALNIADDYHHLKEDQENLVGKISQLSQRLSDTLEEKHPSGLSTDPSLDQAQVESKNDKETEEKGSF